VSVSARRTLGFPWGRLSARAAQAAGDGGALAFGAEGDARGAEGAGALRLAADAEAVLAEDVVGEGLVAVDVATVRRFGGDSGGGGGEDFFAGHGALGRDDGGGVFEEGADASVGVEDAGGARSGSDWRAHHPVLLMTTPDGR
jgi:hypothetical protein